MISLSGKIRAADRVEILYGKAAEKYHRLYDDPVYALETDNWLRTIKQFRIIHRTYPNHYRAPAALYSMARLYRSLYRIKKRQIFLDRSNLSFRKLIEEYPRSPLADDAQFLLAENYEKHEKNKDLAYLEYKNLIDWFPKSEFVPEAKNRMKLLHPPNRDLKRFATDNRKELPAEMSTIRYGGLSAEADTSERPQVPVSKIDYWSTTDWSRMVINTDSDVRYRYRVLAEDESHPQKRLVVDILHAFLPKETPRNIAANDGLISQARIGQFDPHTVRIVLDMVSLDKFKIFHFKLPLQYKIVLDIMGDNKLSEIAESAEQKRRAEEAGGPDQDKLIEEPSNGFSLDGAVSLQKVLGLKVRRIILDPGHGGRDPGASAFGLCEKDVTLGLAKRLREIIEEKHPQIEVLMTRQGDHYLKLEARTAFANQNRGDLFISIHVNASPRSTVRGTETYFLNLTSDVDALVLAAKENQTSMKSISDLQSILNDLLTNTKIKESSDLATQIQDSIIKTTEGSEHEMRDLGVKKAPFLVLLGAQMPSILVEAGFLSNRVENQHLRDKAYINVLAQGIYKGIESYLN